MSAWVKQLASQVAKHGAAKASWYCEWDEPTGSRRCKSCGSGARGKRAAELMAKHIEAEIIKGIYNRAKDVGWSEFRKRCSGAIVAGLATESGVAIENSLDVFERALRLKSKTV